VVPLTDDLWEALNGADCAALVTRHREYQALDPRQVKDVMNTPALIDGRNVFDLENWSEGGSIVRAVGKG
jgi:UDPglucose 6-dehydrogenase